MTAIRISSLTSTETVFSKNLKKQTFVNHCGVENLYNFLTQLAYKDNIIVGVIVNTVASAQKSYEYILKNFPNLNVQLNHSRYVAVDRFFNDQTTLELAGKESLRDRNTVIIGTQVLEQSLDIDFDILYTELAPIDAILQRTGRLHRHSRIRNYKVTEPILNILKDPDEVLLYSKFSSLIYPEYRLLQSENYLQNNLSFFDYDIIDIIQNVYNTHKNNEIWDSKKQKLEDKLLIQRDKTAPYLIFSPHMVDRSKDGLFGWLTAGTNDDNISEQKGIATVRDSISGPEVILINSDGENYFYKDSHHQKQKYVLNNTTGKVTQDLLKNTISLPVRFARHDYIEYLEANVNPAIRAEW